MGWARSAWIAVTLQAFAAANATAAEPKQVLILQLIRLEFSSRGCLRRLPAARFAPARCGFVFVLRNSARAKRRGWITSSSAGADVNVGADLPPRRIIISWRNPDGTIYGVDKDDDSLDDGTPSGSKLIEHEANPKPPDKD